MQTLITILFSDTAIFLYWIPVAIVMIHSLYRSTQEIIEDLCRRNSNEFYLPRVTIGDVVGGIVLALFPGINMMVVIFHIIPELLSPAFGIIRKIFSIPIIPKK